MNHNKQFRILAIALTSRGFGYAVMEGGKLIDFGKKVINAEKNVRSLGHIEKLIVRNCPNILVVDDVYATGTYRAARIKELHKGLLKSAKKHKLRVEKLAGTALRLALVGDEKGTKYGMAQLLAKQFPDNLASRLPPKRKAWTSEDTRMDIFDAVALAVVAPMKNSGKKA